MAFAFFRRRQKMVVIIMAALMVSFLVGYQGFQTIFSNRSGREKVATTTGGSLRERDIRQARSELAVLDRFLFGRTNYLPYIAYQSFRQQSDRQDVDVKLIYALLLAETRQAGISISNRALDEFVASMGLEGEGYQDFVLQLGTVFNISEKHFRRSMKNWLGVYRMYLASEIGTLPSELELRTMYRNTNEKIKVRVLRLSARDRIDEVDEPTADQINKQFDDFKAFRRGQISPGNMFGFGYRSEPMVDIEYLFVDSSVIARVAKPTRNQMLDYYNEAIEKGLLPKASTDGEADAVGQIRQKSYEEAKEEIQRKLSAQLVGIKANNILAEINSQFAQVTAADPNGDSSEFPFEQVAARLSAPKEEVQAVLDRPIAVRITDEPLEQAIETLAKAADLSAICYPWGTGGDLSIAGDLRVSLPSGRTTLAKALDEITSQIFQAPAESDQQTPEIQWGMFTAVEDVLFSVGDGKLSMQPVKYKRTGLIDVSQLQTDLRLVYCFTTPNLGQGQSLGQLAFGSKPIVGDDARGSGLDVGDRGPKMFTFGGPLLWRLIDAVASVTPEQLTEQLQDKITEDLKLKAAYELAVAGAKEITTGRQFAEALAGGGYKSFETDFFSRAADPNRLSRKLPRPIWPLVIQKAFSPELRPDNVEPGAYAQESDNVVTLELQPLAEVFVLRRTGYVPPVSGDYEQSLRSRAIANNLSRFAGRGLLPHFSPDNIKKRMNFQEIAR